MLKQVCQHAVLNRVHDGSGCGPQSAARAVRVRRVRRRSPRAAKMNRQAARSSSRWHGEPPRRLAASSRPPVRAERAHDPRPPGAMERATEAAASRRRCLRLAQTGNRAHRAGGCVASPLSGGNAGIVRCDLSDAPDLAEAGILPSPDRVCGAWWRASYRRAAEPMIMSAPAIATAAPTKSVPRGFCPSIRHSQTSDAAM